MAKKKRKRLTAETHARLCERAENSRRKHETELLSRMVPVNIKLAREIGLPVPDAAAEREAAAGPGKTICARYLLADYADALADYDPSDDDDAEPTATASNDNSPKPTGSRRKSKPTAAAAAA